jgi:hypothetical protein
MATTIDVAGKLTAALHELTSAGLLTEAQASALWTFLSEDTDRPAAAVGSSPAAVGSALATIGALAILRGFKT